MIGYMTTKEAAEKWGVTRRQVQSYCKSGIISGVQQVGKSWLIPDTATKPQYVFICSSVPTSTPEVDIPKNSKQTCE